MIGDDSLSQAARPRVSRVLRREESLSDAAWAQAKRPPRSAAVWREWVRRTLLLVGAPLVLAGVLFFFAYNWGDMPRGLKLVLCQAAVLGAVVGHVWKGRQRLSGRVWLLSATVLTGVWLAVYGQAYQTGADAFELFVAWAVLVTGWVVISDLAAAWLIWMLLWNTALILYWQQVLNPAGDEIGSEFLCVALAALNGVGLVLAEFGARRVAWLDQRWFPNVLWGAVLVSLTIPAFRVVVSRWDPPSALFLGYWLFGVVAGGCVYRYRIRDLTALTQALTAAFVMLVATVGRFLLDDNPLSMLLLGLIIVGASALLVWCVRVIGAAMQREREAAPGAVGPRPVPGQRAPIGDGAANGPRGALSREDGARVATRLTGLIAPRREPLFATLISGLGAWCAACALVAALGFGGLLESQMMAAAGGLCGMAGGIVLLRLPQPSLFTRQLGLALAVAGNLLLLYAGSELFWGDWGTATLLVQAAITLVAYQPLRSAGYRLAAPLSVLSLLVWWLYEQKHLYGLYAVVAVELAAVGFLFLRRPKSVPHQPAARGPACFPAAEHLHEDRKASHEPDPSPRPSPLRGERVAEPDEGERFRSTEPIKKGQSEALEPLAYAAVIALPATILIMQLVSITGPAAHFLFRGWDLSEYRTVLWPLSVLLGFGLVALYDHLAGGAEGGAMGQRWFWWAAGGTLFLAAFTTPGVLVAVGLLVLGFGVDDRAITVLGWVFLGVFLVLYYYALDVTLAYKSAVLVGSGALALAARWALGRWAFGEPEGAS